MSQNSLSSLTHTHNLSTHVRNPNDDVDEGDDEADANSGGENLRSENALGNDSIDITNKIHREFDFTEFYDLAIIVLNGDSAYMEILNSLKDRWHEKFQSTIAASRLGKLKPVAGRVVTPYPSNHSRVSLLSRRTVISLTTPTINSPPMDDGKPMPRLPEGVEVNVPPNLELVQVSPLANFPNPPPSSSIDCAQEILIGNVKLQANPIDNIASAFLQSSRKTLQFVPPSKEKGEIIIRPTPTIVEKGSQRWHSTAFKNRAAMEEIIEEGPWLFQGQPIVLQCWEQVWVRLKHLPMEYWTEDGLGTVASGVGIPLYTDKITKNCSRLDYARVCVMLDCNSTLPKHLVVMNPMMREGQEIPAKVDVEYEWLPQRCKTCCSLGHTAQACPDNKKGEHLQPVQVFVKKQHATANVEKSKLKADMRDEEAGSKPTNTSVHTAANKNLDAPLQALAEEGSYSQPLSNKGKAIVLYNPFEILNADCPNQELEITPVVEHTSSGPNLSSPFGRVFPAPVGGSESSNVESIAFTIFGISGGRNYTGVCAENISFPAADWGRATTATRGTGGALFAAAGSMAPMPPMPSIETTVATNPPEIFIGNVPLQTPGSDFSCDKFAASFNNSTRKTLSFVNPTIQNGEIVVRPSIDVVREGSRRWDNTAVGYFLGRKPYYHHLNEYVRSVWPAVKTVTATSNGFYFFQFKTEIAMEEVIEGGPWLFQGQPIVLQRWEPGMVLRKHKHTHVPVWIRLRHLPVEFWTDDGTVASGSAGRYIKIPSPGHARDWTLLVYV
ncbi:hypothetical protein Sango_3035700 [Sesamum angolense]|uniref:DUF4283 domain-containing protein n=1 Tax=Sesamum angolense TaxID=2727404 RepID=A0AAE1TA32_9LAMI|nr:hypothetical protein Sango_3035700 [Sesamum angolense]